jgi:hypothetical protein
MKRTLSDNLLLIARLLLVMVFVVHLTVVVVGYCVLPEKVVSMAYLQYDELQIHYKSKEYNLGASLIYSMVFLLFGFIGNYIANYIRTKPRNPDRPADYWERKENIALWNNITGICFALFCGILILYLTRILFGYIVLTLSPSPRGEAVPLFEWLIVFGMLVFLSRPLFSLTLTLVKRYRERVQHLTSTASSESSS